MKPRPEEVLVALAMVASAAVFATNGWPLSPLLGSYVFQLFVADFQLVAVGFVGWRLYARSNPFTRVGVSRFVSFLRLAVPLYGAQVLYANWLAVVPLVEPRIYDAVFLAPETWLFGESMTRWMSLPQNGAITLLIDVCYLLFFHWIAITLVILFALDGEAAARRFVLALTLSTVVSTLVLVAFPTLGPAFLDPDSVAPIAADTLRSAAFQADSRVFRAQVLADPGHFQLLPFLGVSAFPSMHVGHTWLALYALWPRHRTAFALFVLPIVGAWIGTVYLGWHYALDGVGGIGIAWAAAKVAERLEAGGWRPEAGGHYRPL